MTKEREALKLALEALESLYNDSELMITYRQFQGMKNSITAIKEALAQPEQNEFNPDWDAMAVMVEEQQRMAKRIAELEAQRKPLTDAEIGRVAGDSLDAWSCARAIEQAHGIKE